MEIIIKKSSQSLPAAAVIFAWDHSCFRYTHISNAKVHHQIKERKTFRSISFYKRWAYLPFVRCTGDEETEGGIACGYQVAGANHNIVF